MRIAAGLAMLFLAMWSCPFAGFVAHLAPKLQAGHLPQARLHSAVDGGARDIQVVGVDDLGWREPLLEAVSYGFELCGHAGLGVVDTPPALRECFIGLPLGHLGTVEDMGPQVAAIALPSLAAVV